MPKNVLQNHTTESNQNPQFFKTFGCVTVRGPGI